MLRMQIRIAAAPERVFAALTSPDGLEAWFAEHADVSPDQGRYDFWGRFTPEAPDREAGRHPLLVYEPGRRIAYTWRRLDVDTRVEFRLLRRDEGCILTLHHSLADQGSHSLAQYTFEDFWFLSLENLRRYLDGKPAEARVDFSQPMTGDITVRTTIDAPAETVFGLLIRPDQLERWIASKAAVDARPDGTWDLGWKGLPPMKIVDLEEGQRLKVVWPEVSDPTAVTWTLESSGGKTRLTLVHSGFAPDDARTGGLKAGWTNFMNWVRSIAEYGDGWMPPAIPLREATASFYAASIAAQQDALVFEETA